jgi:hypothetical protein
VCSRLPLRDNEAQELGGALGEVEAAVDAAARRGGAALVHCHEGRSRSVALVLGYLMRRRGLTLRAALERVRCGGGAASACVVHPGWLPPCCWIRAPCAAARRRLPAA